MWFVHDVGSAVWFFDVILTLVLWGGFIAPLVWVTARLTRRNDTTLRQIPLLDVAKELYSKGEINKEEFE